MRGGLFDRPVLNLDEGGRGANGYPGPAVAEMSWIPLEASLPISLLDSETCGLLSTPAGPEYFTRLHYLVALFFLVVVAFLLLVLLPFASAPFLEAVLAPWSFSSIVLNFALFSNSKIC